MPAMESHKSGVARGEVEDNACHKKNRKIMDTKHGYLPGLSVKEEQPAVNNQAGTCATDVF